MRPSTHLYYSWALGYALLYDASYHLVARAELEDDRHWFWGVGDLLGWRVSGLPRNLPQLYLAYLDRQAERIRR